MQRLQFYIFQFLLLVFYGCNTNEYDAASDYNSKFIREIPIEQSGATKGQADYMYNVYNKFSNELGLDLIKNGFDSVQIRIWLGHSMAFENQIVILKNTQGSWTAELTRTAHGVGVNGHAIQ
ncbi:hypothetical protein [Pollutibacter soli]|uniref:hypothetical protein n=1 Tax=Pollutibacter soli TaxID=3034157 RepID=UPI0030131F99